MLLVTITALADRFFFVFVSRWCMIATPSMYLLQVTTAEADGSRASKMVSPCFVLWKESKGTNSGLRYFGDLNYCRDVFSHVEPQSTNWFSHMQSPCQHPCTVSIVLVAPFVRNFTFNLLNRITGGCLVVWPDFSNLRRTMASSFFFS